MAHQNGIEERRANIRCHNYAEVTHWSHNNVPPITFVASGVILVPRPAVLGPLLIPAALKVVNLTVFNKKLANDNHSIRSSASYRSDQDTDSVGFCVYNPDQRRAYECAQNSY